MEPQRERNIIMSGRKIKAAQSGKKRGKILNFFKNRGSRFRKGYRKMKSSKENVSSSDPDISKHTEKAGMFNEGFVNDDLNKTQCDLHQACGTSNTDITDPMCYDPTPVISVANSEESLPRDVTQINHTRCSECYQYHESLNAKIRELYTEGDRLIREMDAMNNSHSHRVEQMEREIHGLVAMLQNAHVEITTLMDVNASLVKKALLTEEENAILRVELDAEQKKNVEIGKENDMIHKNLLVFMKKYNKVKQELRQKHVNYQFSFDTAGHVNVYN